jgi:uncharacterized protein (TIRG00374 family)
VKIRIGFVLRVLGTAAGLAYIAWKVDLHSISDAVAKISATTFVLAIGLNVLNIVAATVRWRLLMTAYGATAIPPMRRLFYLYFVSLFYNTYLPGAVAGDVGRGVVTRDAFGDEGATGALSVVLIERALGLFGLFALLACGLALAENAVATHDLWLWTVLGVAGSIALVGGIAVARRIAPYLPKFLRHYAERLPSLQNRWPFVIAILLSGTTQLLVAACGWVLLRDLGGISFTGSLLVVPLAAATGFLPITVGGAGAREAVYVTMCGRLFHMPEHLALAASLGLWSTNLIVGLGGGVAQLFVRKRKQATIDVPPAT